MSILNFQGFKYLFITVSLLSSFSVNAALMTDETYFQFYTTTLIDDDVSDAEKTILVRKQKHTLKGFDSSLGVLTSVALSFETDWDLLSRVWAKDKINDQGVDVAQGKAVATSLMTIDLINPDALSPVRNFVREVAKCRERDESKPVCREASDEDGIFDGQYSWLDLSINDFIDTDITLKLTQKLTVQAFSNDDDSTVKAYNKNNYWSGFLNIEYEYQAFNVPEPSTVFLMLIGLFSMGFKQFKFAKT